MGHTDLLKQSCHSACSSGCHANILHCGWTRGWLRPSHINHGNGDGHSDLADPEDPAPTWVILSAVTLRLLTALTNAADLRSSVQVFWAIGTVFEVALAVFVMPSLGWRWLLLLSAVPLLVFAVLCFVGTL